MIAAILRLVRPKQWIKGLLVFAGPLFAGQVASAPAMSRAGVAFAAITAASAATYVVNDLIDAPRDRKHPRKQHRPIASGEVPPLVASLIAGGCLGLAIGLAVSLNAASVGWVTAYLGIQLLYNLMLKHEPVADAFCLASGFVVRAALGAAAIAVTISGWLLFCTAALSLMLAFGKRRHEFREMGDDRGATRASLAKYSAPFLDFAVVVCAAAAAMSYGLYSIESPTAVQHPLLIATSIWVAFAIFRYLHLTFGPDADERAGEPEFIFLTDRPMILSVLGFLATALFALSR
ncbi:MAG: decaprenyl-phosphate phosphoribosyltransferase [Fimbriimonadaceae bacterium]|nr:decaprenyl-phosphate phosphoribosyltransferase [Fimbriimonadaceae bacterium]